MKRYRKETFLTERLIMKIVTIIGARPQFIKAAAVSRQIDKHVDIKETIIHTGQHFDRKMSTVFFEEMKIREPNYNLNINSVTHGIMTGRMLEGIEKIVLKEKPDYVMVYGDTNSTIAGALAAKKLHVKVIHVEAGLRSFNMKMPEEINRILTDRISDILFCPTDTAVKNLKKEGFEHFQCSIIKNGDVMQDAMLYYAKKSSERSTIIKEQGVDKFILCTIHRAENTDDVSKLKFIVRALNQISREIEIVLPLHPRTRKMMSKNSLNFEFKVIDPVGYFDMIELLKHCKLVMTDSGGLQKEAFFLKKHCVTIREETEWTELVENGFNVIAGTDTASIYKAYLQMINKTSDFSDNIYGNGNASKIIISHLLNDFNDSK